METLGRQVAACLKVVLLVSLYSTAVEWWFRLRFVVELLRMDRVMRFSNWHTNFSIISRQ